MRKELRDKYLPQTRRYEREYYKKNREKLLAKRRLYIKKNKDKLAEYRQRDYVKEKHRISRWAQHRKEAIYDLFDHKCSLCGYNKKLQIHHKQYEIGYHAVTLLCKECHLKEHRLDSN